MKKRTAALKKYLWLMLPLEDPPEEGDHAAHFRIYALKSSTPADPIYSNHLVKPAEDEVAVDQQSYQSFMGSLMYLAICTRPCRHTICSTKDGQILKQTQPILLESSKTSIMRYLKGTSNLDLGIVFRGENSDAPSLAYSCRC